MRYFHLGDVLSIATGRVLSRSYVRGVYDVVSHMWRQPCNDGVAYLAMYPECKLWLLKQYPHFEDDEMRSRVEALVRQLEPAGEDISLTKSIVFGWVDEMVVHYGERLPVKMIPGAHLRKVDLFEEAQLIMGPGRAIPI